MPQAPRTLAVHFRPQEAVTACATLVLNSLQLTLAVGLSTGGISLLCLETFMTLGRIEPRSSGAVTYVWLSAAGDNTLYLISSSQWGGTALWLIQLGQPWTAEILWEMDETRLGFGGSLVLESGPSPRLALATHLDFCCWTITQPVSTRAHRPKPTLKMEVQVGVGASEAETLIQLGEGARETVFLLSDMSVYEYRFLEPTEVFRKVQTPQSSEHWSALAVDENLLIIASTKGDLFVRDRCQWTRRFDLNEIFRYAAPVNGVFAHALGTITAMTPLRGKYLQIAVGNGVILQLDLDLMRFAQPYRLTTHPATQLFASPSSHLLATCDSQVMLV